MIVTPRRTARAQSDDNLIPLINVVFLMLIFFMVAGQISRSDPAQISPPASISEQRVVEQEGLTLLLTADGQLFVDDQSSTLEQLVEQLGTRHSQSSQPEQFRVLVKVDAETPVDQLQQLLRQIRDAGLTRVVLATRLQQEAG